MNRLACAVLVVAVGSVQFGCASTPEALGNVQVGMTKAEVVRTLGQPQSVSSQSGTEYLTYSYCVDKCVAPPIYRIYVPFFVRLRAGTVESFGRVGDFDSTKTPTTRVEIDRRDRITQDIRVQDSGDMYVELKKLKDLLDTGVITQAEFDAKKKKILEK